MEPILDDGDKVLSEKDWLRIGNKQQNLLICVKELGRRGKQDSEGEVEKKE